MPRTGQTLILNPWIRRSDLYFVVGGDGSSGVVVVIGVVDTQIERRRRRRKRENEKIIQWVLIKILRFNAYLILGRASSKKISCGARTLTHTHMAHSHVPNQIDWFSLSQCSSSGLIRMSSVANNGFSSGKVSSRLWSGSMNCHSNKITKSTNSNPDTIVYSFHGSTFFYRT